ncbi:hypothetical protein Tco_1301307 [Tanacetum coccineum]
MSIVRALPKSSFRLSDNCRSVGGDRGNFTYECDFVIVEDTTSVIDHYLGGMVLGKPFVRESGRMGVFRLGLGGGNKVDCGVTIRSSSHGRSIGVQWRAGWGYLGCGDEFGCGGVTGGGWLCVLCCGLCFVVGSLEVVFEGGREGDSLHVYGFLSLQDGVWSLRRTHYTWYMSRDVAESGLRSVGRMRSTRSEGLANTVVMQVGESGIVGSQRTSTHTSDAYLTAHLNVLTEQNIRETESDSWALSLKGIVADVHSDDLQQVAQQYGRVEHTFVFVGTRLLLGVVVPGDLSIITVQLYGGNCELGWDVEGRDSGASIMSVIQDLKLCEWDVYFKRRRYPLSTAQRTGLGRDIYDDMGDFDVRYYGFNDTGELEYFREKSGIDYSVRGQVSSSAYTILQYLSGRQVVVSRDGYWNVNTGESDRCIGRYHCSILAEIGVDVIELGDVVEWGWGGSVVGWYGFVGIKLMVDVGVYGGWLFLRLARVSDNGKLLRMVRSGIMKTFTTSDLLKLNSQL